ncbi:hypothetical protein [Gilvimarinus sp. DA14]|uniref:hypothetical protein n=1 Tax=Gilvimarinus sp. DA14 TaxID=2956798 RepID=UPI0020B8FEC2|nr:hypothetical protein [Gilvimarinus sp. DA14]UTF60388.1 hypothetical protein NHM04_00915 [Gilvimarinus sp. DA14]
MLKAILRLVTFYTSVSLFTLSAAAETYPLNYHVDLTEDDGRAFVSIEIPSAGAVREIDFNLDSKFHSDIKANGKLTQEDGRARWQPPEQDARLSLTVELNHKRRGDGYDSIRREDFTIFRGDDLIPPATVRTVKGAQSQASLSFSLPEDWSSVNSGWPKTEDGTFTIDDPERSFDRPTGWFIAGKLGTRRERMEDTHLAISAPLGNAVKRMDVLSFILLNWSTIKEVVGETPEKILIVSAGDPMWRGGLSGPNSLFLHADRPMVSENGTSTLLHELFHTITSISGEGKDDWIAEGLAEYYSYDILHRAGGMTDARRDIVTEWLADWSKEIKTLYAKSSSGERTARAALLFDELDDEIKANSGGEKSLDHAVKAMIAEGDVSLQELKEIVHEITGKPSALLENSKLLATEDN